MNTEKQYPLVSIISINYNQSQITCEMLESLRKITYPNIEIIIIDNNSPSDNPSIIKEKYPEINLILSDQNLGFAGGNNLGIQASKGEYLLFLNNDTEVDEGFLEPLVEAFLDDKELGMASPKIRFFHTPDTIQYAGYTDINPYTVRNNSIGYHEVDKGQYDEDKLTYFGHGAAMLVDRNVIKRVGLMAHQYFLYYEELDWGFRIRRNGYTIKYIHNSLIYHKESISTGKSSPLKIHYLNRNRILFMRRNFKGLKLFSGLLFQIFAAIPKNIIVFILKRQFNLLSAFFKAISWNIKNAFNPELSVNQNLV